MTKPKIALIVAGGKGERMNTDIPKQFIDLQGKPILMHTLEAFHRYDNFIQLVLVLPESQIGFWNNLCKKHAFTLPHHIVAGGETRFQSVKKGLEVVKTPSLVAVHDGVRPLVSNGTIARCFDAAAKFDTAIPVVDLVDSIRQITHNGNISVYRNAYKLVQTPQVFDAELLKKAYKQEFSTLFTDDASVVENLGATIHLTDGNRENIKITTEMDLRMAELLLTK
ncbi:MAG: 2-C-methyl-D-erythritol 4-phosphate cytidylyltransferase [Paludibacter sp.]|nr:2-C-methyl-D-erythritol 4-phosphate cytidylyltransferase [Paludibacter sp.]